MAERILFIGPGPRSLDDDTDGARDAAAAAAIESMRAHGNVVVVATSNPASITSDPMLADRTYLEPLDLVALRAIVHVERPTAVEASFGGAEAVAWAKELGLPAYRAPERRVLVLGPPSNHPELAACVRDALVAALEAGFDPTLVEADAAWPALDGAAGVMLQLGGEGAVAPAGAVVFGTSPEAAARARALREGAGIAHEDAIAVSVDAVSDGKRVVIAGLMEHLEPTFVHWADAAAILPAFTLHPDVVARIEDRVRALALELGIVGLLGVRVAVSGDDVLIEHIEPCAGLTTAFVARATGFPLVAVATKVMLGKTLDELGVVQPPLPRHVVARERVFPPAREGGDPMLGAVMRSTGGAIGIDDTPARAYAKALRGIGISLHAPGLDAADGSAKRSILFAVTERDRPAAIELARRLRAIGFSIVATGDTAGAIAKARVPVTAFDAEAAAASQISSGGIDFAIVTARGDQEIERTRPIRSACLASRIPCFTTMRLAQLGCAALEESPAPRIRTLQGWYAADV